VVHAAPLPGPIHTLLHPRLGNLAARAAFSGAAGVLPPTADLETASVGYRNSLQRRYAARFGGRLPEQERGNLVAQLCLHRHRECQTQLAAWIREVPDSPAREIVLSTLREGSKGRIDPSFVPSLLPLFGVGMQDDRAITPEAAARLTDTFIGYYTHAAPFPRLVLPTSGAALFRRSRPPPDGPRPTVASAISGRSRSLGIPRGGRRKMSDVQTSRPRWREPAASRAWLLVLAWLALILLLSTDSFSAPSTGSLLRPMLRWLFPEWSAAEIWRLHSAIRKAAHVSVYGVLALLAFRAFRMSLEATVLRHAGLAIALVLVAAATDEYRQSLSRARTGSVADVGFDLAGGALALAIGAAWQRLGRGRWFR
jgi:VanZ family protein